MLGAFRLLLALGIALTHEGLFPSIAAKSLISAFFILSGYLITLTLNKNYSDVASFYWNRALRIYPLHILMVCIVGLLLTIGFKHPYGTETFHFWKALVLDSNSAYDFNGPSWTLMYEIFFYLIAPFIVYSIGRVAIILGSLLVFLLFSGHLNTLYLGFFVNGFGIPELKYFGPWISSVPLFMLGSLLYFLPKFPINGAHKILLIISMIVGDYVVHHRETFNSFYVLHALIIAITVLLIVSWDKEHKISKWLGDLCYPLYMIHWSVIFFMDPGIKNAIVISLLLSILWVRIDKIILSFKRYGKEYHAAESYSITM